jgi:hypothetical protein
LVDYILFLDESGGHDLNKVDPNFPVFCLTGCIFEKDYYHFYARPLIDKIKQEFLGNTNVIFHSREIRKHLGDFCLLNDPNTRNDFYLGINNMIKVLDFSVLSIVIDKNELLKRYKNLANNPYKLSLEFILERFSFFLNINKANGYAIAESRGKNEDQDLIDLYRKLYASGTKYVPIRNITSLTTKKKSENINGMQIADLVAYPIATKVIKPENENLSYDIIKEKIQYRIVGGDKQTLGIGLKIFPIPQRCQGKFK